MTIPAEILPKVMGVIALVGQGRTLTSACYDYRLSTTTFKKYVRSTDELQEMFAEAEQAGYDVMADALVEIDRHEHYGHSDPKMAAVISKNIQWFLSKRKPTVFGDKITVEHNITADKAIVAALAAARGRVAVDVIEDVAYSIAPQGALPAPGSVLVDGVEVDEELLDFLST